ncbi:MAG: hypothetical protein DCC75_01230 [Proteobacteria bacterium]|nr:MAG: hypothetical protein DCC75_01230 [Pseudomonadota bacterium]
MRFVISFLLTLQFFSIVSIAEEQSKVDPIKIGLIGSLSSFAASYGTAVLEGARLAESELKARGARIELLVEDDQSVSKNTASAYSKLVKLDKVQGIIGGSWWLNAIAKQSERDEIPLLSCETLYNLDTVSAKTYFLLQGDLRDWIRAFLPVVEAKGWKSGAIVRYVSGFGQTLSEEMRSLFSQGGRNFLGEITYNDIHLGDAQDIVLKIKRLQPEVLYIDAQPGGFAGLLRKMAEAGLAKTVILSNSIAEDAWRDKLVDYELFPNVYSSKRITHAESFRRRFREHYKREPLLNADLGYYALLLVHQALQQNDPIATLAKGIEIQGIEFLFNDNNVFSGAPQEVWRLTSAGLRRDWR